MEFVHWTKYIGQKVGGQEISLRAGNPLTGEGGPCAVGTKLEL